MKLIIVLLLLLINPIIASEITPIDEALKNNFPQATAFKKEILYIKKDLAAIIQTKLKLNEYEMSKLITRYTIKKNEAIIAYAYLDTHQVRTLSETILVSIDLNNNIQKIDILAFNEPDEYKANERWLKQFQNKNIKHSFKMNDEIRGITGASLTADAIALATNKILYIHQYYLSPK